MVDRGQHARNGIKVQRKRHSWVRANADEHYGGLYQLGPPDTDVLMLDRRYFL